MARYRRRVIQLVHEAFPGGSCPDVWIEPRPGNARLERLWLVNVPPEKPSPPKAPRADTGRILQRHRIGPRALPGGLALIQAEDPQGQPLVPAPVGELQFLVCADSPGFALVTDLPLSLHWGVTLSTDQAPGVLAVGALEGTNTLDDCDPPTAKAVLSIPGAWLAMTDAANDTLVLTLAARTFYWRYYCALPQPDGQGKPDAAALAFVPGPNNADPRRIDFGPAEELTDAQVQADPVARAFASGRPGSRIITLTSKSPVPALANSAPRLNLELGADARLEDLPSASPEFLTVGPTADGPPIAYRTLEPFPSP